jgi:hypothetical protein
MPSVTSSHSAACVHKEGAAWPVDFQHNPISIQHTPFGSPSIAKLNRIELRGEVLHSRRAGGGAATHQAGGVVEAEVEA